MKRKLSKIKRFNFGGIDIIEPVPTLQPRSVVSNQASSVPQQAINTARTNASQPITSQGTSNTGQIPLNTIASFASALGSSQSQYSAPSLNYNDPYGRAKGDQLSNIASANASTTGALNAIGAINPILGAFTGLLSAGISGANKAKMSRLSEAKVGWSPGQSNTSEDWFNSGNYATGGDIQLSQDAFQVQGNAQRTDGNYYPQLNARLDHDEVISTTPKGTPFVYSDSIKHPLGRTFAELAKPMETAKGKAEKVLTSNPYDEQAKATIAMSKNALDGLANKQEEIAQAQGHRNPDGSTKQPGQYKTGGPILPKTEEDQRHMPIDPARGVYYNPYTDEFVQKTQDNRYVAFSEGSFIGGNFDGQYAKPKPEEIKQHLVTYPPKKQASFSPPVNRNQLKDTTYADPRADAATLDFGKAAMPPVKTMAQLVDDQFNTSGAYRQYEQPTLQGGKVVDTPAPTTQSSAPKGSGKPAAKKSKYSYDISTQGPLTINNNGQGISVQHPSNPNKFIDIRTKDAFGQLNPSSEIKNIPTDNYKKPLATLPNRMLNLNTSVPGGVDPLTGERQPDLMYATPSADMQARMRNDRTPPEMAAMKASIDPITGKSVNAVPEGDYNYQTPFTVGDAMQGVEVFSKFMGLRGGPEREKAYMDTTPISKASFDVRPQLYQSQRNLSNYMSGVDTGNINLRRAMFNQGYATKLDTDSQTMDRYQQLNNQARIQYEDRLSNQRRFNIGQQTYTNDLNARNRGQYATLRDNAWTSVGNFGEQLNKKVYANDTIGMYKEIYPDVFGQAAKALDREDFLKIVNFSQRNG